MRDQKEGLDNIATTGGEVRWTGPGHPYGPEYNDEIRSCLHGGKKVMAR